jgi:hypothetical protein
MCEIRFLVLFYVKLELELELNLFIYLFICNHNRRFFENHPTMVETHDIGLHTWEAHMCTMCQNASTVQPQKEENLLY